MKMKRDRKIKNRAALCDSQQKCEQAFTSIERLEKSKTTKAMAMSLGIGIVGTAFMAVTVIFILAILILMFKSVVAPMVYLLSVGFAYLCPMGIAAQLIDKVQFPLTSLT